MRTNTKSLIWIIIIAILSVGTTFAADKVAVIPLLSKAASFKGDLYYTVPFSQFQPLANTVNYEHGFIFFAIGEYGYISRKAGGALLSYFNAPVNLPHNAVISELSLSAQDVSDSSDVIIRLQKISLDSNTVESLSDEIDSSSLATDAYGIISAPIDNEIIDNQNYYYNIFMRFDVDPADRLRVVRIKYRLP